MALNLLRATGSIMQSITGGEGASVGAVCRTRESRRCCTPRPWASPRGRSPRDDRGGVPAHRPDVTCAAAAHFEPSRPATRVLRRRDRPPGDPPRSARPCMIEPGGGCTQQPSERPWSPHSITCKLHSSSAPTSRTASPMGSTSASTRVHAAASITTGMVRKKHRRVEREHRRPCPTGLGVEVGLVA